MAKLENMVDKMQSEINRLESKLAIATKRKSPSPKSLSPKRRQQPKKSPTIPLGENSDPEIMREISSAVAARLKEIWALDQ